MPPFTLYVAADLYNRKVNLELLFPSLPTLGELHHHLQAVFAAECVTARPPNANKQQQFGISRIQIYNEDASGGQWADVTTSGVLQPFAQLYVFQSDPNFRESQDQIPPARKPACYSSTSAAAGGSARVTPSHSMASHTISVSASNTAHSMPANSASNTNAAAAGGSMPNGGANLYTSSSPYRVSSARAAVGPSLSNASTYNTAGNGAATPVRSASGYANPSAAAAAVSADGTVGGTYVVGGYTPMPSQASSVVRNHQQQQQHHGASSSVTGSTNFNYPTADNGGIPPVSMAGMNNSRHPTPQRMAIGGAAAAPSPAAAASVGGYGNSGAVAAAPHAPEMAAIAAAAASGSTSNPSLFAAAASHGDKVQIIFESGCRNGARFLQEGDLRALFRDTNIDFAPHIIAALFRQADVDRDGVVTLAELQNLLKEYPTLTDALFFRLKDLQEGELLQQKLAEECIGLEESKRRKDHALAADAENTRRINDQNNTMRSLEGEWQRRLTMEHEITEQLSTVQTASAALKESAAAHNKDLTIMVGRDDAARTYLTEAEREAQYCEQQHSKALQQAQVADHRVQELMELLEAAKAEAAQQHRNVAECFAEVQRSRDNERKAAEQLADFSNDLLRRKQYSEQLSDELTQHTNKAKELQLLLNECQLENEKLAQTIEHSSEDLRRLEHGRDMCRRDITLAEASCAEVERRIKAADNAIVVFAQRRAATEAKEKPLLEQEIRLKEQRLKLDQNENMLRREAYNVFDPLGRGGY